MKNNDLNRFIDAQQHDYAIALQEIKNGRKRSHWMWYIFPQVQGLGFSEMSRRYAINDLEEAVAYLADPVLGQRLVEISGALLDLQGADAGAIFGNPDDMKLRSSMTLFASVPGANPVFDKVLQKFFKGVKDIKTLRLLGL
ncbi:DUF1810 domain-containing protein [Flavitalea sp. BT771]|uniref:DUF1810 domain-containing protein n=1 Tax=Flavitalea sp. BT771 TaxID=3063329 RepID=UPI0026E12A36|nr:DUF1810 domain-containing protein [Flavitalea sp. BT771]MDO6429354.1 DUF1810 domain-containing protein [Flavitalea sp. BT771]MDV6218518.1 DUF1810 domain-containing protein [Flavitalea sp. BT771]